MVINGLRKGYCVRGELETEQRLQHIDAQLFWQKQRFFLVLLGCSTGGLGVQLLLRPGSHCLKLQQLSPNFVSKLTDFLSHPGISLFDIQLLPVASQFALNSTRRQSRLSLDIFDRMHLLFTQVHFLFDSSAELEVNMLQSSLNYFSKFHMRNFLQVRFHSPHTHFTK